MPRPRFRVLVDIQGFLRNIGECGESLNEQLRLSLNPNAQAEIPTHAIAPALHPKPEKTSINQVNPV